jgi:hypothetical protein
MARMGSRETVVTQVPWDDQECEARQVTRASLALQVAKASTVQKATRAMWVSEDHLVLLARSESRVSLAQTALADSSVELATAVSLEHLDKLALKVLSAQWDSRGLVDCVARLV